MLEEEEGRDWGGRTAVLVRGAGPVAAPVFGEPWKLDLMTDVRGLGDGRCACARIERWENPGNLTP